MLPVVLVFLFAQRLPATCRDNITTTSCRDGVYPCGIESDMRRCIEELESALTFPTANVIFYDITETPKIPDNGRWINRNVTTGALEVIDTGDIPLYAEILINGIHDLASLGDRTSQAIAATQVISVIGELANGIPGDSCQAAALINAFVSGRDNLAAALESYVKHITYSIDVIVGLVNDPNGVRYSAGSLGICKGGGRIYQFDKAWDGILNNCKEDPLSGLLHEQFCAARRLYKAFSVRSNNVAAAVTAATIPEVQRIFTIALGPVADFLRVVSCGENPAHAAHFAKNALLQALAEIEC